AGALLLRVSTVDALRDVARLLTEGVDHRAGVAVEALVRVVVTDVEHDLADDLLDLDERVARDLARDHDQAGFRQGFAGDAALRVLCDIGVENRVRHLGSDLVRMALRDGLGRKAIRLAHRAPPAFLAFPPRRNAALVPAAPALHLY